MRECPGREEADKFTFKLHTFSASTNSKLYVVSSTTLTVHSPHDTNKNSFLASYIIHSLFAGTARCRHPSLACGGGAACSRPCACLIRPICSSWPHYPTAGGGNGFLLFLFLHCFFNMVCYCAIEIQSCRHWCACTPKMLPCCHLHRNICINLILYLYIVYPKLIAYTFPCLYSEYSSQRKRWHR